MKRLGILGFLYLGLSFAVQTGVYADLAGAGSEVKLLDGQIADVDWVGSSIDVRWLNAISDQFRETTFKITPDTKIIKGHDSLDLSDVNRGDQVTIAYKIDPQTGEEQPVRITVLVTGTLPPNS